MLSLCSGFFAFAEAPSMLVSLFIVSTNTCNFDSPLASTTKTMKLLCKDVIFERQTTRNVGQVAQGGVT